MSAFHAARARTVRSTSGGTRLAAFAPLSFVADGLTGWFVLAGIGVAAVAIALWLLRGNRRGRHVRPIEGPPLIFPAAPATEGRSRTRPPPPLVPFASSPPPFPVPTPAVAADRPVAAGSRGNAEEWVATAAPAAPATVAAAEPSRSALFEGQTIKFHVPTEGTLQLLPGRLELVAGPDSGQVIRFVRGDHDSEVTFGRSEGPPYRHVQLRVPTVSRRHARMHLERNHWLIGNLSATNPLIVNGEELRSGNPDYTLQDGDRIEMGELIFVYRER
jgi:hypothetical protein